MHNNDHQSKGFDRINDLRAGGEVDLKGRLDTLGLLAGAGSCQDR
jgi:hypothetical protein